ncbi:MAG TPA: FAD-binding oxidoreductase [Gaiellaceae bacterium]|nr:FAD-binding oxidoreductase [Gaiellaceae bacterium]
MTTFSQGSIALSELRAGLRGQVLGPGDPGYDDARSVFVPTVDRRPAAIVRPVDAGEVAAVVDLARESGLELAVRSGGHSGAGHGVSEGGIVLDLSRLKALEIDPERRVARAETGLTSGEVTGAAGAHGLAVGFGDTGSVGIGGLTLGGGVGYLVRKHGLTIDSLLAAEVVTADGRLLHADEERNSDLFWAVRGGGGNFGVATRFAYRLQPVDTVTGGMLVLPATADTISGFIAAAEAAPDELSTIANVMTAPPMPFLPSEHHGELVILATLVHAGSPEAGERAVAPFRALATPIADMLRPMPYPEIYPPDDPDYRPLAAARTMFVDTIAPPEAETILEHLRASAAQMRVAQLRVLGGAMARVPGEATAFAHRTSRIMVNVAAVYATPEETPDHETWVDAFAGALRQSDAGAYVNFLGDEGEERVRAAYPGPTWERLAAVKKRYDPDNLFHLNQNVPPAAED